VVLVVSAETGTIIGFYVGYLINFPDKLAGKGGATIGQSAQAAQQQNLTRDPSLSTILEERSSQMLSACDTPMPNRSVEEDIRGEISLSIDGKEVSVSLYETPDLTENDAKQIIEMFANEYSEYISGELFVFGPNEFVKLQLMKAANNFFL
jgi:hypothetical protein